MPSVKRRAYRSPSTSDDSSLYTNPRVNLIVVDNKSSTIPPIRIPPIHIRVPPHKDWYKIKPIPKAPLPLYHPLRVAKPRPPPVMSTALPLTKQLKPREPTPELRPARQRRPPLKLREVGAAGGSGPNSPTEEVPEVPRQRRQRRTKAEIAAANAAAAAAAAANSEGGAEGTITLRSSKRKRTAVERMGEAIENLDAALDVDVLSPSPSKRRRQPKTSDVTSTYGTRSRNRSRRNSPASATGTLSEEASVAGDMEAPTPDSATKLSVSPPAPLVELAPEPLSVAS